METKLTSAALPPIQEAARQEYEYYGSTLTLNTYLKLFALVLLGVIVFREFTIRSLSQKLAERKPYVVYVNPQTGRAEAAPELALSYRPQAGEMKYFLTRFTVEFFSRQHKTVSRDYLDSLYFLDSQVAEAVNTQDRKTMWLPKFLHGASDDIEVTVNNVVLEETQTEPYRARVEFTKIFNNTNGSETKRETVTAEYQFRFNPAVPNALIPYNPLGLAITYFREDQAFQ